MISYPHIDPVIFGFGPLQVRWYGLMYVLGFIAAISLVKYQIGKFQSKELEDHYENLNFILIACLILGARLGYVVFYNLSYYLHNPADIVAVWHGGMSFHGGLIAMIVGGLVYCHRNALNFWKAVDIYIVTMPIGLGLGRIGNFINGELYGRITDVPWGMIFPGGGALPRHPSQLYESFMEGLVLFIILWVLKSRKQQKNWPDGSMLAAFLIFYGIFRSFIEFFREPDDHLGFILASFTMGQILSGIMIFAGSFILFLRIRQRH